MFHFAPSRYVCHGSSIISCVWDDPSMTLYVSHDSSICVTWLLHLCDMTLPYVWHILAPTRHVCHDSSMTPYVWYDSFVSAIWILSAKRAPYSAKRPLNSTKRGQQSRSFQKFLLNSCTCKNSAKKAPHQKLPPTKLYQKSPALYRKSLIVYHKSPMLYTQSLTFNRKSPQIREKSPTFYPQSPRRALYYSLPKDPCILWKEPYILTETPFFLLKEPCIIWKEACILTKELYF